MRRMIGDLRPYVSYDGDNLTVLVRDLQEKNRTRSDHGPPNQWRVQDFKDGYSKLIEVKKWYI
jgi:hypothetical protein